MPEQTELFPLEDYTDRDYTPPAEWEVTNRSTRRKTPPKRKRSPSLVKKTTAFQQPKTSIIKDFSNHATS